MNVLKITSQFKKDLKRYKHKKGLIDKLELINLRHACQRRGYTRRE